MNKLLCAVAAGYALLPLGLDALRRPPLSISKGLDLGLALVWVLAVILTPLALRAGPKLCAAVWFGLNSLATLGLASLVLTGDFPTVMSAAAAWGTTWEESIGVMSAARYPLAGVAVAWLAQAAGCYMWATRPPRRLSLWGSRGAPLVVLVLALPLVAPQLLERYPLHMVANALDAYSMQRVYSFVDASDHIVVTDSATTEPQLVVLVIGESSRAEYWQLQGYARETTPHMVERKARGELIDFERHMSTAALTRLAVPALLSPFGQYLPKPGTPLRKSVVTLLHEAGFSTAWLSAQAPQPAAAEADYVEYASEGGLYSSTYDMELVKMANTWLTHRATPKGFLVLHTNGSHIPFASQYPAEFIRWPNASGLAYPASETEDSYANSILYTDTVLNSLMQRLEKETRPVLLVYISDHGESQMQGIPRTSAKIDKDVLHVPLILWANSLWKEKHPDKWSTLSRTAATKIVTGHVNLVPTLAGILGVQYKDQRPDLDFLSSAFQSPRLTPAVGPDYKTSLQVSPP